MCTVSFVPVTSGVLIASSRDEKLTRKPALAPQVYKHGSTNILYPKDGLAGGTWIALKETGDAAILLNGAFTKHIPQPPYAQSRGIILLHLMQQTDVLQAFGETSLKQIEPFTLILFVRQVLTECRWDGVQKHVKTLPVTQPHTWSSATLYTKDEIAGRQACFQQQCNNNTTEATLIQWHMNKQLQISGQYKTVSITLLKLTPQQYSMTYHDLANNITTATQLST